MEVIGDKEIMDILANIAPKESRNLARSMVYGIASRITKGAKARAPVKDGILKKGIYTKRDKSPPSRPVSTVRFKPNAFYWRFVERGTENGNNLGERPFLRPARLEVTSNLKQIMREEFQIKLEKRIKAVLKKQAKNGF